MEQLTPLHRFYLVCKGILKISFPFYLKKKRKKKSAKIIRLQSKIQQQVNIPQLHTREFMNQHAFFFFNNKFMKTKHFPYDPRISLRERKHRLLPNSLAYCLLVDGAYLLQEILNMEKIPCCF